MTAVTALTTPRSSATKRAPDVETFWVAETNHRATEALDGFPVRPYPIVFQVPVTALVAEGGPVVFHRYARRLTCNPELCFVMAKDAYDVSAEDAESYIKEYRVLAAFRDYSVVDYLGPQAHLRQVLFWTWRYARWADSLHCLSRVILPAVEGGFPKTSRMRLSVDGVGEVSASTGDYLHDARAVISFLSRALTLKAGDLISLGKAGEVLTIPTEQRIAEGALVHASIDGVGELSSPVLDLREARNFDPPNFWWL